MEAWCLIFSNFYPFLLFLADSSDAQEFQVLCTAMLVEVSFTWTVVKGKLHLGHHVLAVAGFLTRNVDKKVLSFIMIHLSNIWKCWCDFWIPLSSVCPLSIAFQLTTNDWTKQKAHKFCNNFGAIRNRDTMLSFGVSKNYQLNSSYQDG